MGQAHVQRALVNALDQGRLHHAYLFTGTRGVGKTTLLKTIIGNLNSRHGKIVYEDDDTILTESNAVDNLFALE